MINIFRLHADIKLMFNKLNTNHKLNLPSAFIDDIINIVAQDFIEIFYSGNNVKQFKLGFEVTQQRIDMLSNLVEGPPKEDPIEAKSTTQEGVFEFDFSELNFNYLHFIRGYTTSECGNVNLEIVQHDDLNKILNSATRGPSNVFLNIPCVIRNSTTGESSSLYAYTNNKFDITKAYIDYIRCPKKVFSGGYDSVEYKFSKEGYKKGDPPVNLEISEKYYSVFLTMVIQELARTLEDPFKLQASMQKFNSLA